MLTLKDCLTGLFLLVVVGTVALASGPTAVAQVSHQGNAIAESRQTRTTATQLGQVVTLLATADPHSTRVMTLTCANTKCRRIVELEDTTIAGISSVEMTNRPDGSYQIEVTSRKGGAIATYDSNEPLATKAAAAPVEYVEPDWVTEQRTALVELGSIVKGAL